MAVSKKISYVVNKNLSYLFKVIIKNEIVVIVFFWPGNNISYKSEIIAGIYGIDDPGYNCLRNVQAFVCNAKNKTITLGNSKIYLAQDPQPLWKYPVRIQTKIKRYYNAEFIIRHKIPVPPHWLL